MVLGDAMAVALMKMRGFDLDDYALLHPGGQIGKRLTMKVSDVMLKGSNNPIINISESVKNCISEISRKLAGAVSVVDNDGKIMGLVTDFDIRRHIENEENIFSMEIKELMNSDPIFVYEDEKAFSALKIMQEREKPITILSVLNRKDVVVGMLRMHDLVKEGL
jgi:arabinose-5-phosphate isomerase